MKLGSGIMTKIIDCLSIVMDFLASVVPVAICENFRWSPDDEGPVKYGVYLLTGTVIICTMCAVVCGVVIGVLGLVVLLISVAWKILLIVVSVIMLFILLGCLRLGRLKKGGCDRRHD